jgi:hypothetical protein
MQWVHLLFGTPNKDYRVLLSETAGSPGAQILREAGLAQQAAARFPKGENQRDN